MKANREILLEAADREAAAQEFRYAPMGQEGKLEHAIGEAKFADLRPKPLFDLSPSMSDSHEANIHALLFEQMQRGQQGKSALVVAELAVNAEIRAIAREISPDTVAKHFVGREFGP